MIKNIIGTIWKRMPRAARQKVIRATQNKFTVSVAAVVRNEAGEILLLDHVLRPASGWGFPGGFMNAGEQPEESLRREIREETGLELDDVRILQARCVSRHIEMLFTAAAKGEARVSSREIKSLGWFTSENLPQNADFALKQLIEKFTTDRMQNNEALSYNLETIDLEKGEN